MDELMLATQNAEHSLLGAIIQEASGQPESGIIRQVAKTIQPEDFLDSTFGEHLHTRIYRAMLSTYGPLNEITIPLEMLKRAPLPRGTHAEFPIFNVACPTWLEWESYVKAVKECGLKRNPNRINSSEPRGGARL